MQPEALGRAGAAGRTSSSKAGAAEGGVRPLSGGSCVREGVGCGLRGQRGADPAGAGPPRLSIHSLFILRVTESLGLF